MDDYVISCCSTADLTEKYFQKINVSYICFHFSLDGVEYPDDFGKSLPFSKLYDAMIKGAKTRTSQVNSTEFTQYFEKFLMEGKDIIHISLSSGISKVVESAKIAQENLMKKYPQRKIFIVDSLGASSGYGLLVDTLAHMRDEGATIEELYDWAMNNRLKIQHWFFSSDLRYYIQGGRISKSVGLISGALKICLLLYVNEVGKLILRYKIRTLNKVMEKTLDKMIELAENSTDYSKKVFISHSDCYEDALRLSKIIQEKFPNLPEKPVIFDVGTTIGSHTGPGTVALFFFGKERTCSIQK